MGASVFKASAVGPKGSAEVAAERATRAAYLLREALALLVIDPEMAPVVGTKRESDRLLRLPEVQRLTGLRRSAIYEHMQRGIFPRSVKAGPRAATWSEAAVQAWISERIRADSTLTLSPNSAPFSNKDDRHD